MTTQFLRLALAADAAASGATAVLMIAGSGLLTGLLGLPAELLMTAGLVLVPFVALVAFAATRLVIPRLLVKMIVEMNLIWAIASFALLASGYFAPTLLGTIFVAAQAIAVAGFAAMQFVALRQSQAGMA